jgi:hypothetical protein
VDAMAACSSKGVEMGASHGIGHQVLHSNSSLPSDQAGNDVTARPSGCGPWRYKLYPFARGV